MIIIAIICPSEIAFRRFSPALKKHAGEFEFAGIGVASAEEWYGAGVAFDAEANRKRTERERAKAQAFVDFFGHGTVYDSYEAVVSASDVDAVYLPLPPALHYKWAKEAIENGKHVFVEKPSTTDSRLTAELISLASERGLAVHENYMFIYHDQLKAVDDVVSSGELGSVRLYRISFGFPMRAQNDFRYNRSLGGGALIDAGGYTLKYASHLLGDTARLTTAQLNYLPGFEVDMYGSATMVNADGATAQLAFGMDNDYKCEIEIWGSKGTLTSGRILTAPAGFVPEYTIKKNTDYETRRLPADDAFGKSIERFGACISDASTRREEYRLVQREADLMTQFKEMTK